MTAGIGPIFDPADHATLAKVNSVPISWQALTTTCLFLNGCSDRYLSFLNHQGPIANIQCACFLEMVALLTIFVAIPTFVLATWFAWRYRARCKFIPIRAQVAVLWFAGNCALVWAADHCGAAGRTLLSSQHTFDGGLLARRPTGGPCAWHGCRT
jgi:hypothetical protein